MNIALSLLVLTAIALVLGAVVLFRRGGYRKQAVLMLVLAAVMVMNHLHLDSPDARQPFAFRGGAKRTGAGVILRRLP